MSAGSVEEAKSHFLKKIKPPEEPVGARGSWSNAETRLGIVLPDDYKWYIETYGAGKLCDYIGILSPFTPEKDGNLFTYAVSQTQRFKSYYNTPSLKPHPYAYFPAPGGLLSFGTTDNCDYLSWLTQGASDQWKIIVHDDDVGRLVDVGYQSLIVYLADIIDRKIWLHPGCDPSNSGWFEEPQEFIPYDRNLHGPYTDAET